jgi:hypothetical protein
LQQKIALTAQQGNKAPNPLKPANSLNPLKMLKMLKTLRMPFVLVASGASDEGVWFMEASFHGGSKGTIGSCL